MGNEESSSSVDSSFSSRSGEKTEFLWKVVVVGDAGSGKTSVIRRLVHDHFDLNYSPTEGVQFYFKSIEWDSSTTIRLQIWDIPSSEKQGNLTRVYYQGAVCALVLLDLTKARDGVKAAEAWINDLSSKASLDEGIPIPTIVLANKKDEVPEDKIAVMDKGIAGFTKKLSLDGFVLTSAKENHNLVKAIQLMANSVLKRSRVRSIRNTIVSKPNPEFLAHEDHLGRNEAEIII